MMRKRGSVALGEVAAKVAHLEIACSRCELRGRYRLAKLVAEYGEDFPMTDLGNELASCPHRTETAPNKRCDVFFPGLAKIMNGEEPATQN
jgi:hypothetical protein